MSVPRDDNNLLDGSDAKNNIRMQVGTGHLAVNDMPVRGKHSFLDCIPVEHDANNTIRMQDGSRHLVVNDMRIRGKNSFLDIIPVESEESRRAATRRSSSAPHASESERSEGATSHTSSSSSKNTAQKAMMDSSSNSGDSRFIVRGPPKAPVFRVNDIFQQPESDDDDDSFARQHDGTSSFNDTDDIDSSDSSPSPSGNQNNSDNQNNEEAPPNTAGAPPGADDTIWSQIPLDRNGQLTSIGSIAHASGNCVPCVFMRVGTSCRIGAHCTGCHLSHRTKKTRPCKGKRDRQKKAVDRVLEIFDGNPDDFDVHNFDVPSSIRNTNLESQLKSELHKRDATHRALHAEVGASSSSSDTRGISTRIRL